MSDMYVKIISCECSDFWYIKRIGAIFKVVDDLSSKDKYRIKGGECDTFCIKKNDCEIIPVDINTNEELLQEQNTKLIEALADIFIKTHVFYETDITKLKVLYRKEVNLFETYFTEGIEEYVKHIK